jgi:hypothetical protein
MSLLIPSYIRSAGIVEDPIQHKWNESVKEDVLLDQPRLTDRLSGMTHRALLAFSLGSAEWVVWRLSKHLPDSASFQLLEAAWAGTIEWRYLKSFDVPDWLGELPPPIGGPLDTAFWLLREAFVAAREGEPFRHFSAALSELVLRIVAKSESYKEWRRFVIHRLTEMYPRTQENRLGTPVPREALDPSYEYKPELANALLVPFLKALDYTQNPYLRSPEEMIAAGFTGRPYSL